MEKRHEIDLFVSELEKRLQKVTNELKEGDASVGARMLYKMCGIALKTRK